MFEVKTLDGVTVRLRCLSSIMSGRDDPEAYTISMHFEIPGRGRGAVQLPPTLAPVEAFRRMEGIKSIGSELVPSFITEQLAMNSEAGS